MAQLQAAWPDIWFHCQNDAGTLLWQLSCARGCGRSCKAARNAPAGQAASLMSCGCRLIHVSQHTLTHDLTSMGI
jgi:sarcosine oxidase delta subunit